MCWRRARLNGPICDSIVSRTYMLVSVRRCGAEEMELAASLTRIASIAAEGVLGVIYHRSMGTSFDKLLQAVKLYTSWHEDRMV